MTRRSDDRTRRPEPPKPTRPEHADELLDEALDETFPASDPPSVTRPHDLDEEPPAHSHR